MLDKVTVRKFESDDEDFLNEWLKLRDFSDDISSKPDTGIIASINDIPIACLFLRISDRVGTIEGIATDPRAGSIARDLALENLFIVIMAEAKFLGLKHVIGYSTEENLISRVERLGFVKQPHAVLCYHTGV